MKNIDVLFLVEHIDRELDAVTCLAERLSEKYNIESHVRNYYADMIYSRRHYNPKIVVFPFFYGADHFYPIAYVDRWPDAQFINLGWEQIFVNVDVAMKIPRDDIAKKRMHHLCWTQQHVEFLTGNDVDPDNVHLIGNPVMKFYDDDYKNYFRSRKELAKVHRLDEHRRWVLFPENYFFGFQSDKQIERLAQQQNANLEYMKEAKEYSVRCIKKLFTWIGDLTREDDPVFILRPRPSATRQQIIELMESTLEGPVPGNVKIIKAETAREWILASDHVITSHSTTLIEAALAGKPIHLFSPEARPEALKGEWHHLAPELTDRNGFLDAVRCASPPNTNADLAAWGRERLLPRRDPFDIGAEVIAQIYATTTGRINGTDRGHKYLLPTTVMFEEFRKFIQRRPGLYKHTRSYRKNRYFGKTTDVFGRDDVVARISKWRTLRASQRRLG